MIRSLKEFLFEKHVLVNDTKEYKEACFPTVFALANRFGIRITEGMELAVPEMIRFASEMLGESVPEPFYRGFPETVKKLSSDARLYDQMLNYAITYGLNQFSEVRHSIFEEPFERIAFQEKSEQKLFRILDEKAAVSFLEGFIDSLIAGSRPLNNEQFNIVCDYIKEYRKHVDSCGSKNTAIRLLLHFRNPDFAAFLRLPDVISFVEMLNYEENGSDNIRKMNLRNQQREFVSKVLDFLLNKTNDERDIRECFEKRALWNGLLHHIHYQASSEKGRQFVENIRNKKENLSALSVFEKEMNSGNPAEAAKKLKELKGNGALVRNLNYILSRCNKPEDVDQVLRNLGKVNTILSYQMLLQYKGYTSGQRTFRFIRFNKMMKHTELPDEQKRRRSVISEDTCEYVSDFFRRNLQKQLSSKKIGKVFLDDQMKKIALPIQEGTSSSGFGVLPRGSRLPMPEGNKLRCFTYWEKVDDIDLSCFGIMQNGTNIEFSWRTAWDTAGTDAITFSGDETSGYKGGSEYFDIDLAAFRNQYPQVQFVVFADNVFSNLDFSECICKAGFMIREEKDSGEVYEPKTVRTAFNITAKSRYAVLFALDLQKREIVWLNLAMNYRTNIAGEDQIRFILSYMNILEDASVYDFFAAKATELTDIPEKADLIVSDCVFEALGKDQEQIHSYDYEKIIRYLNQ